MRCSLRAQLQARLDAGNEPSQRTDPVILICELSPRWNLLPLLVPVRCLHRQFRGYPPLLRPIPELCTCHRVCVWYVRVRVYAYHVWSAGGARCVLFTLVRVHVRIISSSAFRLLALGLGSVYNIKFAHSRTSCSCVVHGSMASCSAHDQLGSLLLLSSRSA